MNSDLQKFRGKSAEQIVKTLLNQNYQEVPAPQSPCRFFRDPGSTHLIRLSKTPRLSEAFCAASQAGTNQFLPKIFSQATLAPDLHISISENLQRLDELPQEAYITLFGHARAVSSFFAGDEMHKDVHRCMTYEPAIVEAAQAVIGAALNHCRTPARGEQAFTTNPCGDSIWFRHQASGCQTVYADPFMISQKSRAATLKELQWMDKRFSEQERSADQSAHWRDRQP